MCFGCPNEPSNLDGSFEYPQHMFWMSNEDFFQYALISGGLLFVKTNQESITCDPSEYTVDHYDLTVSNIMENSIGSNEFARNG